jgi:adenosylcobinamide-GDP ribazoletransferase
LGYQPKTLIKHPKMQFIRHFLLAVQFFTRIPITGRLAGWVGFSADMLRASAAHFAGVGWIVGTVAAMVYALVAYATTSVFAPLVAACLSTVATVLLTGGFHEDGLADLADGLGGSHDRERALEIMKDSRVGAFGAMALVLALLCKVSLLAAMGAGVGVRAAGADEAPGMLLCAVLILCAHVVSRACPMVLVRWLPHVGDTATSKSKPLADHITNGVLWSNLIWCLGLLPLVYIAQAAPVFIVSVGCALIALAWMAGILVRRLQGFTGDCLGATQQVCETAFYLGAVIAMGRL